MEAMSNQTGHVWIVGAGPGDPGLITLAAVRALEGADVVLYDALVAPAILRHAPAPSERVFVGKRAGEQAMGQDAINALLVEHARAGRRVVRLKGGDPFVFGRGGEEALACRDASVPFTIVPGVTSAIAAAAYAGIPVTHRGVSNSLLIVTGNDAAGDGAGAIDWQAASKAGTLAILMGVATLGDAMAALIAAGKAPETPVACIRWGTRADQVVVRGTVATIAELARAAGLASPVVTVVGDVVALGDELAWFAPGPLAGKRIVVTRARDQASDLVGRFESLGAYVVEAPVISVRHTTKDLVSDERVSSRWDWIVFTSANGVEAFFGALGAGGRDARSLSTTKLAAVGEATVAALRTRGLLADFAPSRPNSDCLAAELPRVQGARILLSVSSLTDDRLAMALRARGGLIEQVAVYETLPEPLDAERRREVGEAHAITFTSASTARHLRLALGEAALPETAKLVSIGPQTSAAVREAFGRVDAEAAEPSLDALVAATLEVLG
jgi:uroporphyrinogen III methyltransferase/synthase